MDQNQTTKTTTSLLLLLFFFCFFLSMSFCTFLLSFSDDNRLPIYIAMAVPLAVALTLAVVFAVRTTVLTWITVMVLLAFVGGKRRRVLVKEGRRITSDVAVYSAQVVLKDSSLVAFGCAAVLTLMAMACLRLLPIHQTYNVL